MKRIFIAFSIILLVIIVNASFSPVSAAQINKSVQKAAILPDVSGAPINLEDYIGKKTTVIWITDGCQVCAEGADNFNEVAKKYAPQVAFILISTVEPARISDFLSKNALSATVLIGGNDEITQNLAGQAGSGICPVDNFFIINKYGLLKYKAHLPGIRTREMANYIAEIEEQK